MSPEQYTKRYSEGWRKHLRSERTAQNKLIPITLEERQRKLTTASWSAVKGLLNLNTSNNQLLHLIYEEILDETPIRAIVKGWYDASYKDATSTDGYGRKYRDEFEEKHLKKGAIDQFDPILIQETKPLLKMVDSYLFKPLGEKK